MRASCEQHAVPARHEGPPDPLLLCDPLCSGLQLVNVPMFFCLRRLVAAFILAYEFVALGKVADLGTYASILCITLSTVRLSSPYSW